MDSIYSQIDSVLSELVEFKSIDLHYQVEGGTLGFLREPDAYLCIYIWHDHFSVLISQSYPKLVIAFLNSVEPHSSHHSAMAHRVRGIRSHDRVESS